MLLNQTASVFSPLVRLIGSSWTSGQSTSQGDVMSFAFQGTAVTVYGSVGGPSSTFDVSIDGGPVKTISNLAPDPAPSALFSSELLSQGMHVIQVMNQRTVPAVGADGTLTLSTVEWAMELPEGTASYIVDNMDSVPSLVFKPTASYWQNGVCTSAYFKADCHLTRSASASMTYTFNGSAISVFAGTNKDHGNYTVQIDGGALMRYSGYTPTLQVRQLIAHAVLTPPNGEHTITIANKPLNASFSNFDFDFLQVFAPQNPSAPSSTSPGSTPPSDRPNVGSATKSSSSSNLPIILGCIIGALAAVLAIIFLWWWRTRRRRSMESPKYTPDPWHPHIIEPITFTPEQMALIGSSGATQIPQYPSDLRQSMEARKMNANFRISGTVSSSYSSPRPMPSSSYPTPLSHQGSTSRFTRYSEDTSTPPATREEEDAGSISHPGAEEVVPPSYQKINFSRRTRVQPSQ